MNVAQKEEDFNYLILAVQYFSRKLKLSKS